MKTAYDRHSIMLEDDWTRGKKQRLAWMLPNVQREHLLRYTFSHEQLLYGGHNLAAEIMKPDLREVNLTKRSREDSNPRRQVPKTCALSPELRERLIASLPRSAAESRLTSRWPEK